MKTLITGGTGLVGRALQAQLSDAVLLSRHPRPEKGSPDGGRTFAWDPELGPAPAEALRGVDAVFHLAGEPVAEGRWTDDKKRRIRDSRELGTRNLVAGLAALEHKPKVLICASAVGYYGDRGDEELDESSAPGSGFLPEVCVAWEREAAAAEALGIRVVCVRIGIVLAAHGGALGRMMTPFKMGLGGKLGSGDQWMSWIHLDDLVGMMLHASLERELRGPMNGVSRTPVTNADFTHALGRALHRPAFLPVPRAALRIAFGEMSEIMMASQRVLPRVAARSGYTFRHPELDSALAAVVAASHRKAA